MALADCSGLELENLQRPPANSPSLLCRTGLFTLSFAEAILGALLILGLLTRWTLALGGLLIAALVFGTALRSDWSTAGVQMVYGIIYYFLLKNLADNYFSVDTLLAKYPKPSPFSATVLSGESGDLLRASYVDMDTARLNKIMELSESRKLGFGCRHYPPFEGARAAHERVEVRYITGPTSCQALQSDS